MSLKHLKEGLNEVRILDLCCGNGLASIGYKIAFPDATIVGIDIEPSCKKLYPFSFICGDAFEIDYEFIGTFDFIHMSPPCQRYSKITPKRYRDMHPHLIPNALLLGYASGKPFVVENVPGSTMYLKPTCELRLGGKTRFFHANFPIHNKSWEGKSIMSSSYSSKKDVFASWGVPSSYNLGMRDIRQGIPPLMTLHIGLEWARGINR